MKITEMHLDDFGIYHNVSWNPPEHGLIVMHGRNESGKTTLMKYVRSMFFGYLRGDWKGYFGSMGIRREDGKEYRIVRNEKEYFLSDGQEKVQEEPANLWWHGLDRQTYDTIFAMGLEDLQGFKILSNEAVRSHFFSIEGGIGMGLGLKGACEGVARNPDVSGKITGTMILAFAFIESLAIYALVISFILLYANPYA